MKILLIASLLLVLSFGCKKDDVVVAPVVPEIVGSTFSAYSLTSSLSGSKIYSGYRFISKTRALELVLVENSRILSQVEVGYTYDYPNIKIEGDNAAGGVWSGFFLSGSVLQVQSLLMKKW